MLAQAVRSGKVLLPVVAFYACSSSAEPNATVTRSDSAGVTVVHYSRLDTMPKWSLSDDPVLSVGEVDGEAPYLLTMASRIQRMQDGSIMVVENRDREVRIFDSAGRYLRSVGSGPGEGPGEFQFIDWARLIQGDSILVWDGRLRRLTVFTPQGELARTANPRMPEGVHLLIAQDAFEDGALFVAPLQGTPDYVLGTIIRDTAIYAWWDPSAPDSFVPTLKMPVQNTYIDRNSNLWSVPFTPRSAEAVGSASVISTEGSDFVFDHHLARGRHVLRVTADFERRTITAEELQRYKDERIAEVRDQAQRAQIERRFDDLPFPDRYPAVDRVLIDALGEFWIRLYNPDEAEAQAWHVFKQSGEHVAFVRIPSGLDVHDVQEDAILGRWTDELGVRTVRVYALQRVPQE